MTTINKEVKGLNVNYIDKKIEVTKAFLKNAGKVGTKEFEAMAMAIATYPNFEIKEDTTNINTDKKSYKNLSVERMLAYIHVFDKKNLEDFENAIRVYSNQEGKIQKGKYATIKKIFLHKCKDGYNALDIEKMVKVDEKEKELSEKANGVIKNALSPVEITNKITEFPTEQKKASNE